MLDVTKFNSEIPEKPLHEKLSDPHGKYSESPEIIDPSITATQFSVSPIDIP